MDIDLIKLHLQTARNATLRDGPGQRDQQYGWTRLHAAVAYGNLDRVRSLLGLVNASSGDGWTPLHVAVGLSGDSDSDIRQEALSTILGTLLRAGADRNARNKDGWTPMHVAAALNHSHAASVVGKLAAGYGVHGFFLNRGIAKAARRYILRRQRTIRKRYVSYVIEGLTGTRGTGQEIRHCTRRQRRKSAGA